MPIIEIFTKDNCVACTMTKKEFLKQGLEYVEVDLLADPAQLEAFKAEGHMSAPIVRVGDEAWAGFKPDRIRKVKSALVSATA